MQGKTLKKLWICGLLLAGAVTTGRAEDPTLAEIEQRNALEPEFEMAHTDWASPYAGRTVRALFILKMGTRINGLPLRKAVEVMQRFDVEGAAVLTTEEGVYGGETGEKRLASLLENPYDCYLVTGESIGGIPAKAWATIQQKVENGAGLFYYGKPDGGLPAGVKPLSDPPSRLSGITADALTLGKGRVVVYAHGRGFEVYRPTQEQAIFGMGLRRDAHYERQGRAILWAAGHEPEMELSVSVPVQPIDREALTGHGVRVTWTNGAAAGALQLKTRFRSQSNAWQPFRATDNLEAVEGNRTFAIPICPAGEYRFDVIAESRRGVEAWATATFAIAAKDRVENVNLKRDWGAPGTSIEGSATVRSDRRDECILRVEAIDRYGRAVAKKDFPKPGETVGFSLPTDPGMPNYLAVKAALVDGEGEIACGYSFAYTIPYRRHDQWNYIMWGRLYASDLDIGDEMLAASGVNSRMETSGTAWWYMSRAGMNYTPMHSSGTYRPPDTGPQVPVCKPDGTLNAEFGCWNAEPTATEGMEAYANSHEGRRGHGILVYNMGDEQATRGSCLHPSCWKVYQGYLKEQYGGDIGALNASWNASFAKFDQIQPVIDETAVPWVSEPDRSGRIKTFANNEISSAGPPPGTTSWNESMKSYPRWYDRRAFQFWNFANYVGRCTEAMRRVDPEAVLGVEGTFEDLDQDIDTLVDRMGYWMPYAWEQGSMPNEVIRCIAPRGYRHGNFISPRSFWPSFMRGANTVGKWRIDNLLSQQMGLVAGYRRMTESARVVFDGLGTLLNVRNETEMLHDGVVMLHSFPSFQAMKLEAGPSYGLAKMRDEVGGWNFPEKDMHKRSHKAWHRTIRSSGLQFDYVTYRQILRGEFDPTAYKTMILSQCESIGPEEESVIREFVGAGGTVIADVRPGIYGARCKSRKDGVLDDLFGVRHTGNVPALAVPGRIVGTVGGREFGLEALDMQVNPAIELDGGRALGHAGDVPVCIVNETGKGRTILLNFAMWSYPNTAVHGKNEDAADFVRAILDSAGLKRSVEIVDEKGRPHRTIEVMRWRTGDGVEVVALHGPVDREVELRDITGPGAAPFEGLDKAVPVTVKLSGKRYVYEMRTGRSGMRTREFATGVRPWWATLLVLSEHELRPPAMQVAADSIERGRTLRLDIRIPDARGGHAVKVEAKNPAGKEVPWFSRSVIVEDGIAQAELPIAHNEQLGKWTVTARDLYTGMSSTLSFRVK